MGSCHATKAVSEPVTPLDRISDLVTALRIAHNDIEGDFRISAPVATDNAPEIVALWRSLVPGAPFKRELRFGQYDDFVMLAGLEIRRLVSQAFRDELEAILTKTFTHLDQGRASGRVGASAAGASAGLDVQVSTHRTLIFQNSDFAKAIVLKQISTVIPGKTRSFGIILIRRYMDKYFNLLFDWILNADEVGDVDRVRIQDELMTLLAIMEKATFTQIFTLQVQLLQALESDRLRAELRHIVSESRQIWDKFKVYDTIDHMLGEILRDFADTRSSTIVTDILKILPPDKQHKEHVQAMIALMTAQEGTRFGE